MLAILGIILAIIVFIILGLWKTGGERIGYGGETTPSKKVVPLWARLSIAILIMGLFLFGSMIRTVQAGQVGIKYDPFNGGVQEETLGQGLHMTHPFVKVYKLKTTHNQLQFEQFSVQTQDSEFAWFIVELKYNMSVTNAYKVFNAYKGMPTDAMLQMDIQNAVKAAAPKYNIYDILGGQFEQLRIETAEYLGKTMEANGLNLISVNFIDIDAEDVIETAIVQKGVLKQEKEQAIQRIAIAEQDQKSLTIKAETEKRVQILDAEAQAERKLLDAKAQAEAMNLIQEQLAKSPEYVNYIKWSSWDGVLPEVMGGDSMGLLMDMREEEPVKTYGTN